MAPRSSVRFTASLLPLALGMLSARAAHAEGSMVPLDSAPQGGVKLNGVLSEWPALTSLSVKLSGSPSASDFAVRGGLMTDGEALYVGADVTDDRLFRTKAYGAGEDKLTVVLAFPEGPSLEIDLFPGDPGNVAGAVRMRGVDVPGAKLVEAPKADKSGYTFEAKIPWSTFPPAAKTRVSLRGALRATDSDGGAPKSVLATTAETNPAKMPRLPIDAEDGIETTFAHEKGLSAAPRVDVVADVVGDAMKERILLWDDQVLVAGPGFRGGKEFFYKDLGVDKAMIPSFEVRDVTGDGRAEIVLRTRHGKPTAYRELFEVLSMTDDGLRPLFRAEIGITTDQGSITNDVRLDGKKIEVALAASSAKEDGWKEPPDTSVEGALLPWGTVKSRTYEWNGTTFAKTKEETKAAADKPARRAPDGPKEPPPPRPPTADELQDQTLALYKKDRHVGASDKPRFDLATNVAEDDRRERILVFGKDLVVFGKGFLGGLGYVAVGLGFADAKDVVHVTTRDLDGDGRAEILVRGVQRMKAPKELGTGTVEREILLVYSVKEGKLARVFAAETGLVLGDRRLTGATGFFPQDKAITLGAGFATGWDKASFPYKQDTSPVGGIEPMVLPWTSGVVRYEWAGQSFARR